MAIGTPKEEVIEKYVKAKDYGHNNAELYRQKEIVQREVLIEKPADPQRRGLHFVQLQSAELELCPGVYLYFVEDIDLRLKFSTIPNGIVLCTMLKENTHPSNGMHAPPRHVLNKLPELPKGVYAFTIPPLMKTTSGLAYIHDVKHPPSTHIHQRVIAVWIDKDVSLPSGMRFVHISRDFVAPSYNLQSAMYLPLNATQVRECSCMYMHTYICRYTHTYIHTHMQTYLYTFIHMYTYMHTHTHTHTHTHIHTYIHYSTYKMKKGNKETCFLFFLRTSKCSFPLDFH